MKPKKRQKMMKTEPKNICSEETGASKKPVDLVSRKGRNINGGKLTVMCHTPLQKCIWDAHIFLGY